MYRKTAQAELAQQKGKQKMLVNSAIRLINEGLVYKYGWEFHAEDDTRRYEGAIKVKIDYPANKSERADMRAAALADEDTATEAIMTYATFRIIAEECKDDTALYKKVLEAVLRIEEHEAREFFRVLPTYWAPFHPHKADGMQRWGTREADLLFGVV